MPMRHIEINETKKKYPFLYKAMSIIPGAIAFLIIAIIIFGYCIFIFNKEAGSEHITFLIASFILIYYVWRLIR